MRALPLVLLALASTAWAREAPPRFPAQDERELCINGQRHVVLHLGERDLWLPLWIGDGGQVWTNETPLPGSTPFLCAPDGVSDGDG